MKSFDIRPASPEDVPHVLALVKELAEYEKLTHLVECDEDRVHMALFGERPTAEALLAWNGGEPAAFAVFFHNFSTFLGKPGIYLEDIFVRPTHRRLGCGRALLVELARIAVARGCGRFEWAVLDWNTPAHAFYESLGATILPDWRITRITGTNLHALAQQPVWLARDDD